MKDIDGIETKDYVCVGWVAIYGGKQIEILKSEVGNGGQYRAKKLAIERLKVPKSKEGLLAMGLAYND